MQVNPYLLFNGQCEAAFKFYEQSLGGRIEVLFRYEGSPMADQIPAEWQSKVMHARLVIDGQTLMGSDPPPERYEALKGFSISLTVKDAAEAERVFQALSANGQVQMPIAETFWAVRFGMLVDQFGIPWMVNCEKTQ